MKIELIVLGIMALSGIAGILDQLRTGFKKTNLNDHYVWGIYIQGCFFLSSISVGILLSIAGAFLFQLDGLNALIQTGNIVAFSLLLGAQVLLGIDLGRPTRAIYMLGSKNFHSPLTWDFYTLGLCTLLSFLLMLDILPTGTLALGIWSLLIIAAGSLCIFAHTMFFLSKIKGGYQTNSFLGLESLLHSLLGGSSVLSILGIWSGIENPFPQFMLILSILLMTTIAGHKIAKLTHNKKHDSKIALVFSGITLVLLIGYQMLQIDLMIITASLFALLSIFVEKYDLVILSQRKSIIPEPYSQFQEKKNYQPSFKEWNVLIGGFAVCVLISYSIIYFKNYL